MSDFLSETTTQVVIWLAALAILVVVGVYVINVFRGGTDNDTPQASELISNFSDLHSQGELSDEEFRTIKSMLAERMQAELKDTGGKG